MKKKNDTRLCIYEKSEWYESLELNAKTKEKIEWTKKKKEIHVLITQIGGGVMILVDIF